MTSYLDFEIGEKENVRGRALFYTSGKEAKSIDIDGASLKEAMYRELLEGRLIGMDIFEPFFVTSKTLDKNLSFQELTQLAKKESRDLLLVSIASPEQELDSETMLERAIAQYTTLYREAIYIRLTQQMANEIFRRKRCSQVHSVYVVLFKLASRICLMLKGIREEDDGEVTYQIDRIREFQKDIPFLDIKRILQVLESGDGVQWQEIANYIDSLFVTIKKHWPFPLENDVHFRAKEDCLAWLKDEIPSLYEEYFLALFQEEYEKAGTIKQTIDSYYTSQSLEECH